MGVNNSGDSLPQKLLDFLHPGSNWRVSVEELCEALAMDLVEVYRRIYELPRGVSLSAAADGFGPDNVGELVTLLEVLGYRDAAAELYNAGIFVPHEAGTRVQERVIIEYGRALARLPFNRDRLRYELSRGADYREAARRVLEDELPLSGVIRRSATSFVRDNNLPPGAAATIEAYLEALCRRNVLSYAILAARYIEAVYRLALEEGFIEAKEWDSFYEGHGGGSHRQQGGRGRQQGGAGDLERARELLGVERSTDREGIRKAYRRAMLRYHPDVNPRGGEIARELNAAYAALIQSIGYSS